MTDVTGPKSQPVSPFDTSADVLTPEGAAGGPAPLRPEQPAFAGGSPKARPAAARPLKEAALDLREDGEALVAAGVEAAQAKAADARRWAELKRLEAAERVRGEPMKAVGVAFGIGLVAGLLLRRR